ncbi:MAG: trehalose-6-phosphate synthase [Novosphingobium sp.]|nr:trehalose-6-phosphate synthase [Novosphingobium sp.]
MNRMIVVSNRVSVGGEAQGGLAVALTAALRKNGGIWFGWSGERTGQFTGHMDVSRNNGVTTATIDLEEQDIEEYYNGYANKTLWPLFHYRIDLAEYERHFAGGYQRVNERFADTVRPLIEADNLVLVQDYHLIPLGAELRKRGIGNRIGFFLHTPWPPRRLLATLPEANELVESMFAYDVVGFQTVEWLDSFADFVRDELGIAIDKNGYLEFAGRQVQLLACPIGIDAKEFAALAASEVARSTCDRLRTSIVNRSLIVGVDRLDYSKGLEERFLGYERFLTEHPDSANEVVLLQIAPTSRGTVDSYQHIRASLEGLAGRINGAHAALDWVPIRYVNKGYPRDKLAGAYRASRIGLVTPLRDGMNLVAKEYVASQDPDDPGVLILSRFAGAAAQMTEAILVNPHSAEEISDAIHQALVMPIAERRRRWRHLMENVQKHDVLWWFEQFAKVLRGNDHEAAQPAAA